MQCWACLINHIFHQFIISSLQESIYFDCYLILGSRDSQLALWKVDLENLDSNVSTEASSLQIPEYVIKKPEVVKLCDKAQKVRALCFDHHRKVSYCSV